MTETEYDILDELYFVTSFKELAGQVQVPAAELCEALNELAAKGYVKCFFPDPDTELDYRPEDFRENGRSYFFLATKAGLLAHNSR